MHDQKMDIGLHYGEFNAFKEYKNFKKVFFKIKTFQMHSFCFLITR